MSELLFRASFPREFLCPDCTPNIITILAYMNEEKYICPRCYKTFHPDNVIASNYTWLYILRDMENNKNEKSNT